MPRDGRRHGVGVVLREPAHEPHPEAQRGTAEPRVAGRARVGARHARRARLERAVPPARVHVDLAHDDAVALRVGHELRGPVEAHGLAVEERGRERGRVAALEPRGDVDEQRERGGVRLGEAVLGEAADLRVAAVGELPRIAARDHPLDEALPEHVDVGRLALPCGHRAPQPVGLAGGEARGHDRERHRLLLEERDAERLREHALDGGAREDDRLLARAAAQVGMHHPALDGPGAHDRDLDHEVVEAAGLQPRQHRHLRARLDLEDADRVGLAEHVVDGRVLGRDRRERPRPAAGQRRDVVAADGLEMRERLAQGRQHAQPEHVDLQDPHRVEVVLVPLDHRAVGHRGVLDGDHLAQRPLRDHEAAHVLGEVAGEARDLAAELDDRARHRIVGAEPRRPEVGGLVAPGVGRLREAVHRVEGEAERLPDVAHGAPRAVRDHLGGQRRPLAAVLRVEVLDRLLAPLVLEVEVDVGRLAPLARHEPLEQQVDPHGVERRHAEAEAHGRVRRGAAPLAEDSAGAREGDEVVDRQEIGFVMQRLDRLELVLEEEAHLLGHALGIALEGPRRRQRAQVRDRGRARRVDLVGVLVAEQVEREAPRARRDRDAAGERLPVPLEEPRHLGRGLQVPLAVRVEAKARVLDRAAVAHAGEDVLQPPPRAHVAAHVVRRDEGHARVGGEAREGGEALAVVGAEEARRREGETVVVEDVAKVREPPRERAREPPRRHGDGEEPLLVLDEIGEREAARALLDAALAERQEAGEASVGRAIGREDEDVEGRGRRRRGRVPRDVALLRHEPRRPFFEDETAADDEGDPERLRRDVGPHDPRERVLVGDRGGRVPEVAGALDEFLGMARAVEEREVRGDLELDVGGRPVATGRPTLRQGLVGACGSLRRPLLIGMEPPLRGGMLGHGRSRPLAVDEPARPRAEDPEPAPAVVAEAEVIALGRRIVGRCIIDGRRDAAVPPRDGDPLGARAFDHTVRVPAPRDRRRPRARVEHDLGVFRIREEQGWPIAERPLLPRAPILPKARPPRPRRPFERPLGALERTCAANARSGQWLSTERKTTTPFGPQRWTSVSTRRPTSREASSASSPSHRSSAALATPESDACTCRRLRVREAVTRISSIPSPMGRRSRRGSRSASRWRGSTVARLTRSGSSSTAPSARRKRSRSSITPRPPASRPRQRASSRSRVAPRIA